jgi:hypothetical protein
MKNQNDSISRNQLKERQFARLFDEIDDEMTLLVAEAKFNFATCKIDENTLILALAYINDTKNIVNVLKNRINLLMKTTNFGNTPNFSP